MISGRFIMKAILVLIGTLVHLGINEYIPPGPKYPCPTRRTYLHSPEYDPCHCKSGSDAGLFIECENTNLANLAFSLSSFAAFDSPIEELKISRANISVFHGDIFYALKVRVLRLESIPIHEFDAALFRGINSHLQQIHIVSTNLTKFPEKSLEALRNIHLVRLDGHNISALPEDLCRGFPTAESFQLSNGSLAEISVGSFNSCKKLKKLFLSHNNITQLKSNQFKGLRDLEVLDLSHNKISKLEASYFNDLNKLGWINMSHNELDSLPRGVFARSTVLKVLNLGNNRIKRLDPNSFRGMRLIRRIFLNDNLISDLGRNIFSAITRIGTIDLARNKLKKIDSLLFSGLQYAELIDVSKNEITEIEKEAFKDIYLAEVDLSKNKISKIAAGAFINCNNLTRLDFTHNQIEQFNKFSFDENTYALSFQLSHNLLKDMSKIPLANMTGLKILNVSHNEITTIPRNTFPKLYNIFMIDASHNKIEEIAHAVFQPLLSLRFLNLHNNSIEEIKSPTFGAMSTVLELDLSYNKLFAIGRGAFNKLDSISLLNLSHNALQKVTDIPPGLTKLDLSYNQISEITPLNSWPSMNALLYLNLSHNNLQDFLVGGSFSNLLTLRFLDLSFNQMSIPPVESIAELSSMQGLDLQGNIISELGPKSFGKQGVLSNLNLANNEISIISVGAFEGLIQLTHLNLSSNKLSSVPNGAFFSLVALQTLDLSYNEIETLDNKTNSLFEDLLSLENIHLSHNKISYISRKTFPSIPYTKFKIKRVDLSYNTIPVMTTDMKFGTSTIISLNLSHNIINEITPLVIKNLTSLHELDLSYNNLDINHIEKGAFALPPNMTYFSIANNNLKTIPIDDILSSPKKLHVFDIRNNQFPHLTDELLSLILNGTTVLYDGNSFACNCSARRLYRFVNQNLNPVSHYSSLRCSKPETLRERLFVALNEDELRCDFDSDEENNIDFRTTPDVMFNKQYNSRALKGINFSWKVSQIKDDIGDLLMVVRPKSNLGYHEGPKALLSKLVAYNIRSDRISNVPSSDGPLQLCLFAQDSEGKIRDKVTDQCEDILVSSAWDQGLHRFLIPVPLLILLYSLLSF
ncbi:unnamed protein product [Bemisia tabaci]|uniref:LRRCT domain-containing protein n=2 Tax=Bemisia tabaci TaxID=7038 RepID=A0A9P0EZH0_BEMTA|nr:unnamed protein product [Bemisia tabaci]